MFCPVIVASIPSPSRLAEMRHVAESLGMDALVEVHNEAELTLAVESGATPATMNFNRVAENVLCSAELFKQVTRLQATRRSVGGDALRLLRQSIASLRIVVVVTIPRTDPHRSDTATELS